MSELAPLRRAFCASAFCLYTYDYEVDDIQWRALRTPYVAQSNFCNMCKGILLRCFIIIVIISTKQRGFWKRLKIIHDLKNTKHYFHRSKLFLIGNVWYCNLKFIFATAWHKNRNFCCTYNKLSIKIRGYGKVWIIFSIFTTIQINVTNNKITT